MMLKYYQNDKIMKLFNLGIYIVVPLHVWNTGYSLCTCIAVTPPVWNYVLGFSHQVCHVVRVQKQLRKIHPSVLHPSKKRCPDTNPAIACMLIARFGNRR